MHQRPKALFVTHWQLATLAYEQELRALSGLRQVDFEVLGWGANILLSRWERVKCYAVLALRCMARWRRFDAIVTNQQYIALALCLFGLLIRSRPKVIMLGLLAHPDGGAVARFVSGAICRNASRVVVFSRDYMATLQRHFGTRVPIEFRFLPNTPIAAEAAAGETRDVFAGGLSNRDFETLLKALGGSDYSVTIVTPQLESPQSNIEVVGELTEADFYRLMCRHHAVAVLLKDARQATGQLLLTRALSAGKFVIATDGAGTRDYIADGVTGRLVPPGDAPAVFRAVEEMRLDPDHCQRMRSNGRAFFDNNISWDSLWSQVERWVLAS